MRISPKTALIVFLAALVLAFVIAAFAHAQLQSGDSLDGVTKVRFSGEQVTFTGCLEAGETADYADVLLLELGSGFTIDSVRPTVQNGQFTATFTLPRVGFYVARARLCFDGSTPAEERCSEWIQSDDVPGGTQTCVLDGGNFVLTLLAPPGAPEI